MSSERQRLADLIRPMLPTAWQRIEAVTVRNLGTLDGPRVYIDYTSISGDGMPQGQTLDGFEVALISHLKDYAQAEDDLDAAVRQLVRQIDADSDIYWTGAEKRAFTDSQYLGWVVSVQLLTPNETE